jgi:hypothetical protein
MKDMREGSGSEVAQSHSELARTPRTERRVNRSMGGHDSTTRKGGLSATCPL